MLQSFAGAFLQMKMKQRNKCWHDGILCEKVKQYPVIFDKQLKGYREKDVVTNAWNAMAKRNRNYWKW